MISINSSPKDHVEYSRTRRPHTSCDNIKSRRQSRVQTTCAHPSFALLLLQPKPRRKVRRREKMRVIGTNQWLLSVASTHHQYRVHVVIHRRLRIVVVRQTQQPRQENCANIHPAAAATARVAHVNSRRQTAIPTSCQSSRSQHGRLSGLRTRGGWPSRVLFFANRQQADRASVDRPTCASQRQRITIVNGYLPLHFKSRPISRSARDLATAS